MANESERPLRAGMVSLGCAKNLVDSEVMIGALLAAGMEITNDPRAADVLIVNTCSFIEASQQESIDTILESAAGRDARNPHQALVVAGCLSQRYRQELPGLLPEVDAFIGIDQVRGIGEVARAAVQRRSARLHESSAPSRRAPRATKRPRAIVRQLGAGSHAGSPPAEGPAPAGPLVDITPRPTFVPDFATPRFRLTPAHFAYVKIAEGCNHPCSFCIIPQMRGAHRSRAQADIVAEAAALLDQGCKELNLISQDSTYYGLDLRPRRGFIAPPEQFRSAVAALPADVPTLVTLLRALNELPGEFWVRLLYTHPAHWTDELISAIAECPKVARYIDIPLQHIHDNMLERMRRETSQQYIIELLERIRARIPGIAIRTTFIVGFPGETEACFQRLLDYIAEARFERLGIFTYSPEPGTRAAAMAHQIPAKLKEERRQRAMQAQKEVARDFHASLLGRRFKVLLEQPARSRDVPAAAGKLWEHGWLRAEAAEFTRRGPCTIARSEMDAPDIDGRVYVAGRHDPGRFGTVEIVGHSDYDLMARVV